MGLSAYAQQLGAFVTLVVVQSTAILLFKLCQVGVGGGGCWGGGWKGLSQDGLCGVLSERLHGQRGAQVGGDGANSGCLDDSSFF